MKTHELDGFWFGGSGRTKWKAFVPRWWQVWRWLEWFRSKERGHIEVVVNEEKHDVRVTRIEGEHEKQDGSRIKAKARERA